MKKGISLLQKLLKLNIKLVLVILLVTSAAFMSMALRGWSFEAVTAGNTVMEFRSMPIAFPIFWYWLFIWPSIGLFPIINVLQKKVALQVALKSDSHFKSWSLKFMIVGCYSTILSSSLFLVLRLFTIKVHIASLVVFVGGGTLVALLWLLLSLTQRVELSFFVAMLFPLIGINQFFSKLPTNFLMPVRIRGLRAAWWQVFLDELVYICIFYIIGWLISSRQEFTKGGKYEVE